MNREDTDRLGVCSWSLEPEGPGELIGALRELGARRVQLALDPLRTAPRLWADAGARLRDAGVSVVSGQFGAIGEDYATPQAIRNTGGVVPDQHWHANLTNAQQTAKLVESLQIKAVSTHAGFIPPQANDPVFDVLVQRLGTLADLFADCGAALLLETGQETAETLERFLAAVGRPSLGVNFDPANMLLYDMGDPVASVERLMPWVRQVHLKDATPPATPGAWGQEVPVGEGAVDWPAFLGALKGGGYAGDLIVEREAGSQRTQDVAVAMRRVAEWLGEDQ